MVEYDQRDLVCLYLAAVEDEGASATLLDRSATAIGDALEVGDAPSQRVRLLQALDQLERDELIVSAERTVEGRSSPWTVYELTDRGRDHASEVRERVRDESVVVTNGITETVRLGEIGRYLESPSPLVTALARLTDGEVPLERPEGEQVFVDREDELGTVRSAIEGSFTGESRTVVVGGAAGMGKTALVRRAIDEVSEDHEDLVTARGDCPPGLTRAYDPVRQAFANVPGGDAVLAPLAEAHEEITPDDPENLDAQRVALFNAIADGLRDLSSDRPVVVFLDGLQWADPATLALFEHLATDVTEWIFPVAFVGTYRPSTVETEDHSLEDVRATLRDDGRYDEVTVDALHRTDTGALVEGILGTLGVPDAFVDLIHDRTGGVPLFVEETVRSMRDRGLVDPDREAYPTDADTVQVPDSITEEVGERLSGLDAPSRHLLELGAVIGDVVPVDVLAAASTLEAGERRDRVELLVASRIWERPDVPSSGPSSAVADGSGAESVRFVSGVVREAIVDDLPDERREKLHRQVAAAFAETAGDDAIAARIAHHYEAAGDAERAIEYYRRAGDHAIETYANETAVDNYVRALSVAERAGVDDETVAAVARDLAEVRELTGDHDGAIGTATDGLELVPAESTVRCRLLDVVATAQRKSGAFEEAREAARRQRDLATDVEANDYLADALDHLGWIDLQTGDYDSARDHFELSRSICLDLNDREGAASSRKNIGSVAFYRDDYEEARECYRGALESARAVGARRLEADCLNNLGMVAWRGGDHDRARTYYEESLDLSRDLGDRPGIAHTLNNLGVLAQERGDIERATEYHEESLALSRELGDRSGEAASLGNLGGLAQARGDLEAAREYYEEGLAIRRELGERRGIATALHNLGEVAWRRGIADEARTHFEESLAIAREIGDRHGEATSLHSLGLAAREGGEYDRAREYHEESLSIRREIGDRGGEGDSLAALAAVDREVGDHDRARERLDRAEGLFETVEDTDGLARVRLERGRLALAEDDLATARDHARAARDDYESVDTPEGVADARLLLGRIAAADGDPSTARGHFAAALEDFEDTGTARGRLEALAELAEVCREQGDREGARRWIERARAALSESPEAAADRYRDRIETAAETIEE